MELVRSLIGGDRKTLGSYYSVLWQKLSCSNQVTWNNLVPIAGKGDTMNFELLEEQRMWKDVVHDFVVREIKPKAAELAKHTS